MVECLPSMQSVRLAPERHKNQTNELLCPGAVTGKFAPLAPGTGHLPFTLGGKALLSAASLTWRCSSGTVTGPHLVCTAHSPVQYLCGSFSFRRYWFVAHCLCVIHTSRITGKKEQFTAVKIQPHAGSHCAACHQSPFLHHHGTQL